MWVMAVSRYRPSIPCALPAAPIAVTRRRTCCRIRQLSDQPARLPVPVLSAMRTWPTRHIPPAGSRTQSRSVQPRCARRCRAHPCTRPRREPDPPGPSHGGDAAADRAWCDAGVWIPERRAACQLSERDWCRPGHALPYRAGLDGSFTELFGSSQIQRDVRDAECAGPSQVSEGHGDFQTIHILLMRCRPSCGCKSQGYQASNPLPSRRHCYSAQVWDVP